MSPDRDGIAAREAGFGIVEAVVALALVGVVLSLTVNALNASRHALRVMARDGGHISFAASLRYLEQRLADAQPLYEKRFGNEASIHFAGEPDRMSFLTALEGSTEAAGGLHVVEFGHLGASRSGLSLRITPYLPNRQGELTQASERVIDTALSNFALRYFGPAPDGGPAVWQESWRDRSTLPVAVYMQAARLGKPAERVYIALRLGRALTGASSRAVSGNL